jgi:hypothetical protein
MCLIFSRSVHTGESSIMCFTDLILSWCKYFSSIMSCQTPYSFSSLHHHLHRRLIFIFLISFIPRPPFFLLLHIYHLPVDESVLFLCTPTLLEKILLCLSNVFVVVLGRRYIDIWYVKEPERLEFIRVVLPTVDMVPPFHTANFLSPFSSRGFQSLTRNLQGLTGTPRYLIGKNQFIVKEVN